MRFEVIEPERCRTALGHLEQVIRLSRDSWTAIEAETDDDHEWIPNAKQKGAIPDMQVSGEMIAGWREFLDEAEAILAGRRLVRHWRLAPARGIDLRRVFLEPRTMDLVRWVQGAAAVPYVAEGECSDPEFWLAACFQRARSGSTRRPGTACRPWSPPAVSTWSTSARRRRCRSGSPAAGSTPTTRRSR